MKVSSIRFNLKFFNANGGEETVRSLDDLAAKFNLCDLWEYFRTGDLARWLKSINELQLAETIESLTGITDKQTALNKLCEALGLAVASDEILELCEILDRHERARESHKKLENLREQMRSGEVPEVEAHESLSSFENTYYINDFNSIMEELNKFKSDNDYRNIEKLKAFEQKFNMFLNRFGRTFVLDFVRRISGMINAATMNLGIVQIHYGTSTSYQYTDRQTVGYICTLDNSDILVWSLTVINKRWGNYLRYLTDYDGTNLLRHEKRISRKGNLCEDYYSRAFFDQFIRISPPSAPLSSSYLFLTNDSPVRTFSKHLGRLNGIELGYRGLIF